jgi:hypothetical protein
LLLVQQLTIIPIAHLLTSTGWQAASAVSYGAAASRCFYDWCEYLFAATESNMSPTAERLWDAIERLAHEDTTADRIFPSVVAKLIEFKMVTLSSAGLRRLSEYGKSATRYSNRATTRLLKSMTWHSWNFSSQSEVIASGMSDHVWTIKELIEANPKEPHRADINRNLHRHLTLHPRHRMGTGNPH